MVTPNANTELPFWVVVESSARAGQPGSQKFYSGCDTATDAMKLCNSCNQEEKVLFEERQRNHRIAVRYTYSVIEKPAIAPATPAT